VLVAKAKNKHMPMLERHPTNINPRSPSLFCSSLVRPMLPSVLNTNVRTPLKLICSNRKSKYETHQKERSE
jgi:hypothetical protein